MTDRIESQIMESNTFVVGDDKNCFIVDAGSSLDMVEKVVGDRQVLGILLTHGHYDHAFYALDYAKKFGCKIYGNEYAKKYLKDPAWNYSDGKFSITNFKDFVFLGQAGVLTLGDFEIEYKLLGGHSESDMLYKYHDEIFVGDVLLGRDMGRIDLYGGSKTKMEESLQKLIEEEYQVMHCGHGDDCLKAAQDKVAKVWLRFLSRNH